MLGAWVTELCDPSESSPHQTDPWQVHTGGGARRGSPGSPGNSQGVVCVWPTGNRMCVAWGRPHPPDPVERFPSVEQNLPSRQSCSWSRGSPQPSSVSPLCPRHCRGPWRSGTGAPLHPCPQAQPGPTQSQSPGHVCGMNATGTQKLVLTRLWPWRLALLVEARLPQLCKQMLPLSFQGRRED